MVQTFFELKGKTYKIKYQKVYVDGGELYQGIIFVDMPIGFSFVIKEDKTVIFDNGLIDKKVQNIIIKVIEGREKRNARK